MASVMTKLTAAGVRGRIFAGLAAYPAVYKNHCQMLDSSASAETYAFPGSLPIPRQMLDGRSFQPMQDFSLVLTNNTYELSFIIRRDIVEDDQTGLIMAQIDRIPAAWSAFEDSLFATLLTNGNVAGNLAFDGVLFHGDSRAGSALGTTIDNNTTSAAAVSTIPNAQEFVAAMDSIITLMDRYADDQGRVGHNAIARTKKRVIIPPSYQRSAAEAFNSVIMPQATTTTNTAITNAWGLNLAQVDVLPFLTGDTEMFVSYVGDPGMMPFCYQERTPLEVVVYDSAEDLAEKEGLQILCRKRMVFGYGDPRRSVLHTWS